MIGVPQSTSLVVNLKLFLTGTTTPATGKTLTITASKNGSAFGNLNVGASPTVTELSNGWYKVTVDTTDTNTIGDLIVAGAASGCDTAERIYRVVLATNAGLTALPNTACTGNASLLTSGSGTDQINVNAFEFGAVGCGGFVDSSGSDWPITVDAAGFLEVNAIKATGTGTTTNYSGIASAVWKDATAGDFTVVSSIGKSLYTSGSAPGASGGLLIAGSNAATSFVTLTSTFTGNLTGSVANVTGTVGGNIAGSVLGSLSGNVGGVTGNVTGDVQGRIIGSGSGVISGVGVSVGSVVVSSGTITNLTNAPTNGDFTATMKTSLNAATPAVTVSDKTGFSLSSAGIQAIWDALTSALTTIGSIGKLLVTNIDAAISGRMATYTQPTGFLATIFPSGTIANTTNITAGTITTVTNLTNAPTSGDFTSTMKGNFPTSLNSLLISSRGSVTLSSWDNGTSFVGVTLNGASHLPDMNVASYAGDNSINTNGGGLPNVAATATVDFDDLLTTVVDGALTFQDVLKLVGAALAGKNTGAGTTSFVFRNPGDTKNRISATLDTNGNRVSLTYDLT